MKTWRMLRSTLTRRAERSESQPMKAQKQRGTVGERRERGQRQRDHELFRQPVGPDDEDRRQRREQRHEREPRDRVEQRQEDRDAERRQDEDGEQHPGPPPADEDRERALVRQAVLIDVAQVVGQQHGAREETGSDAAEPRLLRHREHLDERLCRPSRPGRRRRTRRVRRGRNSHTAACRRCRTRRPGCRRLPPRGATTAECG